MIARIRKALAMIRQLPGAAWRLGRRGRLLYAVRFLARIVWLHGPANAALELAQHLAQDTPYAEWIAQHDTLGETDRRRLQSALAALPSQPLISLLMPTYNSPERWLREAVDSIRSQIYPRWQLCLVDDASTAPHVRPILEALAREDDRIRLSFRDDNGHISAASNDALGMAEGEFVGLVDHDDLLAPHALALVAIEIACHPEADLIYSDEDKIDLDGRRFGPYFKPDWNPDLMRCQNMISHFGVYRTGLAKQVGGFRRGYEGSQDWDLALRVIDASDASRIRHLPYVLYHWRTVPGSTSTSVDAKSYAIDAGRKAVGDHLVRLGIRRSGPSAAWAPADTLCAARGAAASQRHRCARACRGRAGTAAAPGRLDRSGGHADCRDSLERLCGSVGERGCSALICRAVGGDRIRSWRRHPTPGGRRPR